MCLFHSCDKDVYTASAVHNTFQSDDRQVSTILSSLGPKFINDNVAHVLYTFNMSFCVLCSLVVQIGLHNKSMTAM